MKYLICLILILIAIEPSFSQAGTTCLPTEHVDKAIRELQQFDALKATHKKALEVLAKTEEAYAAEEEKNGKLNKLVVSNMNEAFAEKGRADRMEQLYNIEKRTTKLLKIQRVVGLLILGGVTTLAIIR